MFSVHLIMNIIKCSLFFVSYFDMLIVMGIEVNLDMMLVKRKMKLIELSQKVGISMTNLSLLKTGRVKAIRFSTLSAICRELQCQPGDILEYVEEIV